MRVRIAAFRDIVSGYTHVFDFEADALRMVRISEFVEVELPERSQAEVTAVEAATRAQKVASLERELETLRRVSP